MTAGFSQVYVRHTQRGHTQSKLSPKFADINTLMAILRVSTHINIVDKTGCASM